MTNFPTMLSRFAKAVAANDGAATSRPCSPRTASTIDGFFGEYKGRTAIVEMLQHFHDTGSNYRWDFFDPMSDGPAGYARYRFSYASGMPGAEGKPVDVRGHFVLHVPRRPDRALRGGADRGWRWRSRTSPPSASRRCWSRS